MQRKSVGLGLSANVSDYGKGLCGYCSNSTPPPKKKNSRTLNQEAIRCLLVISYIEGCFSCLTVADF